MQIIIRGYDRHGNIRIEDHIHRPDEALEDLQPHIDRVRERQVAADCVRLTIDIAI